MDARVPLSSALSAFGVSAVVTRPNTDPITTLVMWVPPAPDLVPSGMDFQFQSSRRVLVIPRSTVPACPVGTVVVVAEQHGDAARSFRVDSIERQEPDHTRAVMV